MDALQQLIYHEKVLHILSQQEKGSMMCAQHALNTLLQNNYFSASDLSELARSLDELEAEYRSREEGHVGSSNMDDTGYFSVQVLDKALEVWGLSLVRWRSQELAQYHDDPDTQQSFILNLHQHWFTIRRFGASDSTGHWFNLNSFFDKPQRVGVTYLGMVLNQAEAEGYSVFAVRPLKPGTEGPIIPFCEADEVASTLPDPQSHFSATPHAASTSRPAAQPQSLDTAGFEDEDIELQRALQASLQDTGGENGLTKETLVSSAGPTSSSITRSHSEFAQSARRGFGDLAAPPSGGETLRELHASASRSRALLERARLDQQMAFQEQGASRSSSSMRRSRADQDEDELLQRAMEESLKESRTAQMEDDEQEYLDLAAEDNNSDYFDAEDGTTHQQATPRRYPATRSSTRQYSADAQDIRLLPLPGFGEQFNAPTSETTNRVVDDEDAELQAALRASLEGLPGGFMMPELPKRTLVHSSHPGPSLSEPMQISREEEEEEAEEEDSRMATEPPEERQQLSVEEIRRLRLARFGG